MATRHAAIILVATVFATFAAASAFAENVPLPTPAPHSRSGAVDPDAPVPPGSIPSQPNGAAAQPNGAAAPSTDASPPDSGSGHSGFFPFSLPFNMGGQSGQATAFDEQQRHLLDRVSVYLSGIQTLVGNFVQIAPDGSRTDGTFYIQKPGKVRFEYNPPSPTEVIADGSSVAVRNRDLNTQDLWPLSQTPLRYLLAGHIDLLHDTDVVSVSSDDKYITIVVEEKQIMVGTSRLMMMFDEKDLTLRQWTVTDPQGLQTTVAVYNLNTDKKPDPDLFVINYQRNSGVGNQ
jgi:outer membrane lipoprotein-sorting protein